MQLSPSVFDQKLNEFLEEWTLERVRQMTLEQYTQVGSNDTFTYWLEYKTIVLGDIRGRTSQKKYEVFAKEKDKNYKGFITDGRYVWNKKLGNSAQEAFENIRAKIISIINFSNEDDFEKIEQISTYHSIARWKIAFLYSNRRLLPIYSQDWLRAIAGGLGMPSASVAGVASLYRYIMSRKLETESVEEYSFRLIKHYVEGKTRNYFIVGTKYKDAIGRDTVNVFPQMLENNAISIGFLSDHDLSNLVGKSKSEIFDFVEEKHAEGSLIDVQRNIYNFLQINAGDIIALKSHGGYNALTIISYAEVIEKDGSIYQYDPSGLGHLIHVNFLEINLYKKIELTYSKTVHWIKTNSQDFTKIFGSYALFNLDTPPEIVDEAEEMDDDDDDNDLEEGQRHRRGNGPITINLLHNKMQNQFVKYLKTQFRGDKVKREYKGRIDVLRISTNEAFLYEIKPYNSAYECIRAAIGQLLEYKHLFPFVDKTAKLVIVGPCSIDEKSQNFLSYLKGIIDHDLDYLAFEGYTA